MERCGKPSTTKYDHRRRHEYADRSKPAHDLGLGRPRHPSVRFFVVARDIGGQLLGAFDDSSCAVLRRHPGVHPFAAPYLHSHSVLPVSRCRRRTHAQIAQRETPSPAVSTCRVDLRSARTQERLFQYRKTGSRHSQYLPNHYGITTSSLGGSLPTDRCVAGET